MHTISNAQKEQNMDCLTHENNLTCKQKHKREKKTNIERKNKIQQQNCREHRQKEKQKNTASQKEHRDITNMRNTVT